MPLTPVSAIVTYADLQNAVKDYLNRGDLDVQVPLFIQLCEAEIKRRLRRFTVRASITIQGDQTALPSACAELRSARLVTGNPNLDQPLICGTQEMVSEFRANHGAPTGRPQIIGMINATGMLVAPTPDANYPAEIFYYQGLVPLATAPGGINIVLTESPDLYLFGSLAMAEPFLKNDDRLALWQSLANKAYDQLETVASREEYGASLRPMRLPVVFG
jgi:hypothetical protein